MSFLTNILYWKIRKTGFTESWTEIQNYKIYSVRKSGLPGKPWIILLHGIGANLAHWHSVLSTLNQQGYPVLAFELPGHGKNKDLSETLNSESLFELCSKFLDSLSFLGLGPCVFVGNSLGASVLLEYTLRSPEKVHKLIMISPTVPFENDQQWEELKKTLILKSNADADVFLRKVYAHPPKILPLIRGLVIEDFNRKGVLDLLHSTTAEKTRGIYDRSQLKVKTLFIWGKAEKFFEYRFLQFHKRMLPAHVEYDEPDGIGHCPQLERPGWVAERVLKFITAR